MNLKRRVERLEARESPPTVEWIVLYHDEEPPPGATGPCIQLKWPDEPDEQAPQTTDASRPQA